VTVLGMGTGRYFGATSAEPGQIPSVTRMVAFFQSSVGKSWCQSSILSEAFEMSALFDHDFHAYPHASTTMSL
jgi:hypothetical protein